ncbi:hypothetical protein L905_04270 [Agrobacterium sp. TS43]|nr:hypothetical protein L902_08170 [Agrobacterium radiobacter DSM 30147]KVK42690.1 hypothetical protein L904_11175 [Agrobacterium sp. LY4]KVK43023.1 hypothetical protein L903_11195 [Agrobacterium sp. JL28]KVK43131.1 hypothetical protein L901_07370 [Agrobacterium sp. D14]KVK57270.1 hypothetical protein L906_11160 [Agrobacterium sp. TS45]KVK60048.1 hypothetical protein L907_11140 [Agrobacterium sp. C13]KVK67294.1 hypothetical protein L905_04270 [Agrobacterium sp. TS43]
MKRRPFDNVMSGEGVFANQMLWEIPQMTE